MVQHDLEFNDEDLPYEQDILRNPYSVKCWLRYVEHKGSASTKQVNQIYERALKELPGSYKLWYAYLRTRREQLKSTCISNNQAFEDVNNSHERALVFMHKMPRIWIDYCKFLVYQRKITRTRRTFDRALRALPITQHHRIWPLYINFIKEHPVPETAVRVFRRMLKLQPENAEEYKDYLISIGRLDEACLKLADIVNDDKFVSKEGKTNHELWHELCALISQNPDKVNSLDVEAIIRGGLRRFTDQLGQLWCSLAEYYVRSSLFERARDIYEEAITTVNTKRDFNQIFTAYTKFEEQQLEDSFELYESGKIDQIDVEMQSDQYEDLLSRQPLLVNSVMLRQNPHDVSEWLKRVQLYEGDPQKQIETYSDAIKTIDIPQSVGKVHELWVSFAKFYDKNGQLDDARSILKKAVTVNYKQVNHLANVWCQWAELEIEHENYEKALEVMKQATKIPKRRAGYHDNDEPVQCRVYRSIKLWSFYADLEESFGSVQTCKAVYEQIIDLRVANPQIIINCGVFLEDNKYFEDAFKVYERGVMLFKWPNVYDIWKIYLDKFTQRYGGKKLERSRELFDQCLEDCPKKFSKNIYLMYAKLEEEFGTPTRVMQIYEKASENVLPEQKHEIFNIQLKRVIEFQGYTATRKIYEKALEETDDDYSIKFGVQFATMETKLGEIDRARAIYKHCSEISDPRKYEASFWAVWSQFESNHGNEDTLRDMLRIKRSVQAKFNVQVNYMSAQMLATAGNLTGTTSDLAPTGIQDTNNSDMALLEQKATRQAQQKNKILFVTGEKKHEDVDPQNLVQNPNEIDIESSDDESSDDNEDEVEMKEIEQKQIPEEVFGKLAEGE